jgi:alkanesulfonate monooxygenase SsuD/methylene tetrahydromethanopterin reductase-like flavin-dependent oxidoreductase (luciferase family)
MSVSVLVPTTGQWTEVAGYAALADELGYDSINCSHIRARDSFTTLAALASVAPRVRLATAVAPIYHRSPASMAQTAATVDDLSGGRFRLGLGTGHRWPPPPPTRPNGCSATPSKRYAARGLEPTSCGNAVCTTRSRGVAAGGWPARSTT